LFTKKKEESGMKRIIVWAIVVLFTLSMVLLGIGCKEETAEVVEEVEEAAGITLGYSLPFIEDSPYTFPFAEALRKAAAA